MGAGEPPGRLKSRGAPELVIGQSWAIGNSGKWRRKQNGATERRSTGPPQPISPTSRSARTAARSPDHLEPSLAIKTLDMALATRGPERLSPSAVPTAASNTPRSPV